MTVIKIAPSILAADFARLGTQVEEAEAYGADWIHVDVMDGRFVPNISVGVPVVRALRRVTRLPLDVHLMIVEPERYLDAFADAGADWLTVHVEASPHLHRAVQRIHELQLKAGVAINPATPLVAIEEILPVADLILVMSVNPGFGGQRFIPSALSRIGRVRRMVEERKTAVEIEVDGGIDSQTAGDVVAAGATVLVAGTAVFGSPEGIAGSLRQLRRASTEARKVR